MFNPLSARTFFEVKLKGLENTRKICTSPTHFQMLLQSRLRDARDSLAVFEPILHTFS